MIRWIQAKTRQSSSFIALFCFLFLGGVDLILQGPVALLLTLSLSLAVLFAATSPIVSLAALVLSFVLQFAFEFEAGFSAVAAILSVSLLAAFAPQRIRLLGLMLSVSVGALVAWHLAPCCESRNSGWRLSPKMAVLLLYLSPSRWFSSRTHLPGLLGD